MRKCAELSTEVEKVASISNVYITCHYICKRNRSSHTAWCPQASRLNWFAVCAYTKTCNLKYKQHGRFL